MSSGDSNKPDPSLVPDTFTQIVDPDTGKPKDPDEDAIRIGITKKGVLGETVTFTRPDYKAPS